MVLLAISGTLLMGSQLASATTNGASVSETTSQYSEDSILIANLRVIDVNGIQRTFYMQGQQLELATTLDSRNGPGGPAVVITEVRDESDITLMLDARSTVILGSVQVVSIPWIPEVDGEFNVRLIVLQSLDNPIILSSLASKTIKVHEIRLREYHENNEAAISIGVADEKVRQLFDGQEMILFHVRAFGIGFPGCQGACGTMYLTNGNASEGLDLGIDLTNKRVVSIRVTPGLVSEDSTKAFSFVEDNPSRATIKFRDLIPLENFTAAVSELNIAVHYVEYVSKKTRAGHGSVWEPFDADTLKAKLESQGDELVGILLFSGIAQSEDWLKILRLNANSASLDSLEIRGSKHVECLSHKEIGEVIC